MSLATSRLELHMIQCIRTFQRYPDTPTMKLSVQQIDEPLRLEGVILNLGSDELYQGVTIKIARVQEDEEDAGVLHVILTADDFDHLELVKGDKLAGASTQLPVDLVATDAITLKVMAADDPVGSWDYTQSPEGPKERRRLWIACATKKFGESLVETCKQVGATYRFYHAGVGSKPVEGTSAKEDVKNTSAAWRNVHVIISTTTIEVAINVKLPFLARWLFATHHPGSLASELMQLVSRVPRGQEEEERNARLTDHRIFVLFSTCTGTSCRMPTPEDCVGQVDDSEKIESSAKSYMVSGQKAHAEEARAKRAKLEQLGEASAGQSIPVDESLNALRGSVKHYRQLNDGAKHAVRFFEIAAKCGDARPTSLSRFKIALEELQGKDEPALRPVVTTMLQIANESLNNDIFEQQMDAGSLDDRIGVWMSEPGMQSFQQEAVGRVLCMLEKHEEMPPLTDEEKAELDAHSRERAEEAQARESDARALLDDALREKEAVDTPKNAPKRYELIVNYQRAQAQQITESEELDEATALTQVRRDFWKYCEWMLGNTRDNDRSAFQMLQLDVYFNLQPFIFGDDAPVDAFEYIAQDARPGRQYHNISELKTGAIRLARLRTLSVETLRAETQLKTEKKEAHVESIDLESLRAINVHRFFSLLQVPDHQEMEPLAWLTHGAELWPEGGVSQCLAAHNRLIQNNLADRNQPENLVYPAAEEHLRRGDMDLRRKLLQMAHDIAGKAVPRTGSKGPSIVQAIKHALEAIGLAVDFNEKRIQSRNYATACVVYEASLHGKRAVGFSLADAVEIRVRGRVAARAADFRLAHEGDEHERAAGFSDEEEDQVEVDQRPSEKLHELLMAFDPSAPRREGFDAASLSSLLADLSSDTMARSIALGKVNQLLRDSQEDRQSLLTDRMALMLSLDMDALLRELDKALSTEDAFGRRWLEVAYDPSSLGRKRIITSTVEMRTLNEDEDPLERRRFRSLGYGGMFYELRGSLGGSVSLGDQSRLCEVRVSWASLVIDGALRLGIDAPVLRQVVARPDDAVQSVRAHYYSHGEGVDAAGELLQAAVHGGLSHSEWLKRHSHDAATAKSSIIVAVQQEVRMLSQGILAANEGIIGRERALLPAEYSSAEQRRSLWIRWLQSREDALLSRLEQKLHTRRRERTVHWMRESTIMDSPTHQTGSSPDRGISAFNLGGVSVAGVSVAASSSVQPSSPPHSSQPRMVSSPAARGFFDEGLLSHNLAAFRPLCPVAYVPGALLVEDTLCRDGEFQGVDHDFKSPQAWMETELVLHSKAPNLESLLSEIERELRAPSEGAWREIAFTVKRLERSAIPPTVQRARQVVANLPHSQADQFNDDAEFGG